MKQKRYMANAKSKRARAMFYISSTRTHLNRQTEHRYCYCNHHHGQSKETIEDDCNDDFYHIKAYYQPIASATKSGTLNQRTNFIYNKCTTARIASTLSHVLHSLSRNNGRSLIATVLFCYLLLVQYAVAAPQSCILCDKNDLQAKDPQTNYEEFLFEHQVTRQDAINALKRLNDSFYEGTASGSSCNGVRCTEKVMNYCLGPQFINDHCWCEVGHSTEGLPFVPHICYVGEKIYKTSVGSCFFFEEVKDCCCSSLLAREWRHISVGSSVYSKILLHDNSMLAVIILVYLVIMRSYN